MSLWIRLITAVFRRPGNNIPRAMAWLRGRVQLRRCTRLGAWPRIWGRVVVINLGTMVIGDRVQFRATPWATELTSLPGGVLEIGSGTFINAGVSISATHSVSIGSRCQIGPRVFIMDNDYHVAGDPLNRPEPGPVVLEDMVWVGAGAIILKGVRVGAGASIGAGSVVTRNVPAGAVVAGVPARPLRGTASTSPIAGEAGWGGSQACL